MQLFIGKNWDGAELAPQHVAEVQLRLGPRELELVVDAPFHGDPPPKAPTGPCAGLWNHEVVEVFLLGEGQRYTEIELGPHGHHLVLRLQGRRNIIDQELSLEFDAAIHGARWRGRARLDAAFVPAPLLRVNAFAIWGEGEGRRYAAHAPAPGPAPDFHRLEVFVPWNPN